MPNKIEEAYITKLDLVNRDKMKIEYIIELNSMHFFEPNLEINQTEKGLKRIKNK